MNKGKAEDTEMRGYMKARRYHYMKLILILGYIALMLSADLIALCTQRLWAYRLTLALVLLPLAVFLILELLSYSFLEPVVPESVEEEYREELERIINEITRGGNER